MHRNLIVSERSISYSFYCFSYSYILSKGSRKSVAPKCKM